MKVIHQKSKTGFLVYLYKISKCPGISEKLPPVLAHRMPPFLRYCQAQPKLQVKLCLKAEISLNFDISSVK